MNDNLPSNHEEISERIIVKCKKLIDLKYWDNIKHSELLSWYNNFHDGEEKYLACAILENIIYRSSDAIKAFSSQLIHVHLPQILEDKSIYEIDSISQWVSDLNSHEARSLIPIRFTTIEDVDNKTAKSGHVLLRDIQREHFDKELILSIKEISKESFLKRVGTTIKCIIIIDDILCTGSQLDTFIKKHSLESSPFHYIYCPLSAMADSITEISSKYKNITIKPIELINEDHFLFSEKNKMLNIINPRGYKYFKSLYLRVCNRVNLKMSYPLGFGDKGLTYLFNHSTPNNNLALLTQKNKNWNKLVAR